MIDRHIPLGMSHKRPPSRSHGGDQRASTGGVVKAIRTHVRTWASRYVEMRVDAVRR